MPSIEHVELGAYLVSSSSRDPLPVKHPRQMKIFSWVQYPIRLDGVAIEIQDSPKVVAEDNVRIETARNTVGMLVGMDENRSRMPPFKHSQSSCLE
jgi:hypothetical protein